VKLAQLLIVVLLNTLITAPLFAANISLHVVGNKLNAKVDNIKYPKALLMREMKSGLPNVLEMIMELAGTSGFETIVQLRYIITYDLWDEHYLVTSSKHGTQEKKTFKTDAQLLHWLSSVNLNNINNDQIFANEKEVQLNFQSFFNPVKSERIKKIKSWISTSKGFDASGEALHANTNSSKQFTKNPQTLVSGENSLLSRKSAVISSNSVPMSSGPRFQKLFDKILADHLSEDAIAAQWKSERLITTFTLESLLREKH
jgi:hypothetical protein